MYTLHSSSTVVHPPACHQTLGAPHQANVDLLYTEGVAPWTRKGKRNARRKGRNLENLAGFRRKSKQTNITCTPCYACYEPAT